MCIPLKISKEIPFVSRINQSQCLAVNIYFEAKGESLKGMKAVAAVVYNRKDSRVYPSSLCAVVFQNKQFSWTHQQDKRIIWNLLEGDLRHLNHLDKQAYRQAQKIARMPQKDLQKVLPKSVLWYHASTVSPKWSHKMQKVKVIGSHVFYANKKV